MVSTTDPHGRILGFYNRAATISSKNLLNFTHEAEWTPFQTHYSENLVAQGIEPALPDFLSSGTLTTRPQRRSNYSYKLYKIITLHNFNI
jgi:hypothetical protein